MMLSKIRVTASQLSYSIGRHHFTRDLSPEEHDAIREYKTELDLHCQQMAAEMVKQPADSEFRLENIAKVIGVNGKQYGPDYVCRVLLNKIRRDTNLSVIHTGAGWYRLARADDLD